MDAKKAAELACSWMSLVGLPNAVAQNNNGASIPGEIEIPGWGTIPGSDSARIRVAETKIALLHNEKCDGKGKYPIAAVTVKFKFPLVLPLAGRMISWAANHDVGAGLEKFDYGHHEMTGGNHPAWAGQQTVMDASGKAEHISSPNDAWSADGKYPFITLTETCILPMPYSTARFPANGYVRGGGM